MHLVDLTVVWLVAEMAERLGMRMVYTMASWWVDSTDVYSELMKVASKVERTVEQMADLMGGYLVEQ